jgi:hypothetical protein
MTINSKIRKPSQVLDYLGGGRECIAKPTLKGRYFVLRGGGNRNNVPSTIDLIKQCLVIKVLAITLGIGGIIIAFSLFMQHS